jgi:hypothetical protein
MKNLLKVTFLVYILFNSLTYAVTNELYLWDFVCDDNNCDTTSKKEISVTSA